MPGPHTYIHKPTVITAMQFTDDNTEELRAWLQAEIPGRFILAASQLVIYTTQGDQARDIGVGGWVIKRKTPDGFELYPVEDEVIANDYGLGCSICHAFLPGHTMTCPWRDTQPDEAAPVSRPAAKHRRYECAEHYLPLYGAVD